jgi:hypothetical protein
VDCRVAIPKLARVLVLQLGRVQELAERLVQAAVLEHQEQAVLLAQVAHLDFRVRLAALVRPGCLEQVDHPVLQELAERLEALALLGLLEPVGHQERAVRPGPAELLGLLERLGHQAQVGRPEPAGHLVGLELQEPAEHRGRLELVVSQGFLEFQERAALLGQAERQDFLAPAEHPEQVELLAFLEQAEHQV